MTPSPMREREVVEVRLADDRRDDLHDHVVHQRVHHRVERDADDHRHRQVEHVPAHDELPEVLQTTAASVPPRRPTTCPANHARVSTTCGRKRVALRRHGSLSYPGAKMAALPRSHRDRGGAHVDRNDQRLRALARAPARRVHASRRPSSCGFAESTIASPARAPGLGGGRARVYRVARRRGRSTGGSCRWRSRWSPAASRQRMTAGGALRPRRAAAACPRCSRCARRGPRCPPPCTPPTDLPAVRRAPTVDGIPATTPARTLDRPRRRSCRSPASRTCSTPRSCSGSSRSSGSRHAHASCGRRGGTGAPSSSSCSTRGIPSLPGPRTSGRRRCCASCASSGCRDPR